jgi:hypothetical protein
MTAQREASRVFYANLTNYSEPTTPSTPNMVLPSEISIANLVDMAEKSPQLLLDRKFVIKDAEASAAPWLRMLDGFR